MDIKFNITYHAVERLQQRFGVFCSKIPLLKNWKREQGLSQLKPLFNHLLDLSDENKSYLNNSGYMLTLYEKYGYDNEYCFLEFKEENILFLLTKPRSSKDYLLVTLMPTEYRPSVKNIKYSGKSEREILFNKFLMDWSKTKVVLNNPIKVPNIKVTPKALIKEVPVIIKTKEVDLIKPSIVVDKETKLLHETLISSIKNNTAMQIERFSKTKCMYCVLIGNNEYEFTYSKTSSGLKNVIIHNNREINTNNGLRQLEPKTYFYQTILKLIKNNEAVLTEETTSEKKVYNVQLYNHVHNISLIDNGSDNLELMIKQNKKVMMNTPVDRHELKNSGEKLKENNPIYIKLMEATISQNFKVIEKYSILTSLRVTTIDDVDYQYVYIKNKNDRDFILQDTRERGNNISIESFETLHQLAKKSLNNDVNRSSMRV